MRPENWKTGVIKPALILGGLALFLFPLRKYFIIRIYDLLPLPVVFFYLTHFGKERSSDLATYFTFVDILYTLLFICMYLYERNKGQLDLLWYGFIWVALTGLWTRGIGLVQPKDSALALDLFPSFSTWDGKIAIIYIAYLALLVYYQYLDLLFLYVNNSFLRALLAFIFLELDSLLVVGALGSVIVCQIFMEGREKSRTDQS